MLNRSIALGLVVAAAAVGMATASAPVQASTIWSWSFANTSSSASGTFTTTDVADLNNPVGTYSLLQVSLDSFNGNPVSLIDTSFSVGPKFRYISATNYGFFNNLGFSDSGSQSFDGGVGTYLLSGSAAYEASLAANLRRPNLVNVGGDSAIQNPADLQVSLLNPPATVPEPQTLALSLLAWGAAVVARKRRSQ